MELAVLADLLDGTTGVDVEGRDQPTTARVKGDLRMAKVLAKAVHDRQRPLRRTMRVGYGLQTLSLTPGQSQAIVADAKRRFRLHNAGRRHVEASVFATLADSARVPGRGRTRCATGSATRPRCARRSSGCGRCSRPADLLHDLFGSAALIELAAGRSLSAEEQAALVRPRAEHVEEAAWTVDDVPLLDEARALLGPKPRRAASGPARRRRRPHLRPHRGRRGAGPVADAAAHAHPPLAQRLDDRRRRHRPVHRRVGPRRLGRGARAAARPAAAPAARELTIGYRLPGPEHGAGHQGARARGARPHAAVVRAPGGRGAPLRRGRPARAWRSPPWSRRSIERSAVDPGSVAVIVPDSLLGAVGGRASTRRASSSGGPRATASTARSRWCR